MKKIIILSLLFLLGSIGAPAVEDRNIPQPLKELGESQLNGVAGAGNQTPEAQQQLCLKLPSKQAQEEGNNSTPEVSGEKDGGVATSFSSNQLEKMIIKCARQHGVEEKLIWAVMRKESGFNPKAVSPKGAMGLMQLMPGTAAIMGVLEPFDPEQNIAGGVKYLKYCLNKFGQDVALALAAYNAGPGNVEKYQGCPPFAETQEYVASVMRLYSGKPFTGKMKYVSVTQDYFSEISREPLESGFKWKIPPPLFNVPEMQYKITDPQIKGDVTPNKKKKNLLGFQQETAKYPKLARGKPYH